MLTTRTHPLTRTAAGGVLALAALSLTACGDTAGPETGTSVEDVQEGDAVEDAAAEDEVVEDEAAATGPYDGLYDSGFYDDLDSYEGMEVTVSADVNEVLSPSSFVIAGTDDTSVDPLLVVGATEVTGLEPALTVAVTGTVSQAFDLVTVEEELGVDLDDARYEEYDQQPYITASSVDTSVVAEQ